MPAPGEEDVTHVAQAIVPVVVIVPPVMGEVVAMEVTVPEPLIVCHPCADPPLFMPHTWFAVPLVLMFVAVAALPPTPHDVHVPVRFVITPDAGVPSAGVTSVRFVALSPLGSVVLSEGTPLPLVTTTALFTGLMNPVVFAAD